MCALLISFIVPKHVYCGSPIEMMYAHHAYDYQELVKSLFYFIDHLAALSIQ